MLTLLEIAILVVDAGLALMVGYLLLLTIAAFFAPRRIKLRETPSHRFIFLIPAYNEERLIPSTLASLRQLDYPRELFEMHVVVDNSTDRTVELALEGGAVVHERKNTTERGKPYALRWAIQRIEQSQTPYDALIILDADTVVDPDFLRIMDARMARGERAIQAYYTVRDAEQSWNAGMRAIALTAVHFLRPQGRMALGASVGLKGNGMVFATDIVRRYEWPASLTEDIEYHMMLILGGERVTFAPDAVIRAEMPNTLDASQSQNVRWERGRVEMVRNYVPRLLGAAFKRRSFLLFDSAAEQIIPPFSILAGVSLLMLIAAAIIQSVPGIAFGAALVIAQAFHILVSLILARLPKQVYKALLYIPIFIPWKLWLYFRVLVGLDKKGWVRTARNK